MAPNLLHRGPCEKKQETEPEAEPEPEPDQSGLILIFNRGCWVRVQISHLDTIVDGLDFDEQIEYMVCRASAASSFC